MYKVEESGERTETNHVSLMNFGPLTNSTTQCGDFSLLSTQNKKENLNVKKTCRNISQVIYFKCII